MESFAGLSLSPSLIEVVGELGYTEPTPVQVATIPVLLAGKDLIGQSKTGSGKTAAFALPILQQLSLERRHLQALVVCPTRELSAQVAREFRKLGRRLEGLQVLVVSGGEPIRAQLSALERGVHIVVGTPGRLNDHLLRDSIDTRAIKTVVLDEADRMLDMGFQDAVEKILSALPSQRQTVLFSATFPSAIEAMSRAHQRAAERVTIGEPEQATAEIRQAALIVDADDKLAALYWVLNAYPHDSALIFCNFKATVADVARRLGAGGASVDCLHGDLEQFQRDQVLAKFRNQSVRILIATDVAARGIDVEDLDLVVNYELPDQPEIYVHRIGRTGRAGKQGLAVSLATPRQQRRLEDIEQLTGTSIERVKRPDLEGGDDAFARDAPMATILISGGRKDKVRPGDILGALTGDAGGLAAADVGKIEIHDTYSYVAVAKPVSSAAARALNQGRIKARRFRATLV
jgi:ATP-independent RNA helicase DbpA